LAALIARVAAARVGPERRSGAYRLAPRAAPKAAAPAAAAATSAPAVPPREAPPRDSGEGPEAEPREAPAPRRAPRLIHASDNVVDRIDALVAWTLANHRCSGVFVADDNGLTLAAHGVSEALVSIVGPLLATLASVRAIPGVDATAGALWLGAQMMSWVEARTERGGFCVGVLSDEALSAFALSELKDALQTTIRGI
jgi:hypothetical protein